MSIHTVATHTSDHHTTALLGEAVAIMTIANVDSILAAASPPPSTRGTKPSYGAYNITGILCALYEMSASHRPYSFKELLDTLWFRYTTEQMALIGLGHLRTSERLAAMNRPTGRACHTETANAVRANRAEYQRLTDAFRRLFHAMDDTPLVANHKGKKRPTIRQVAAAANNESLVPKRETKWKILNAIIAASVNHENQKRYPGHTVHEGILADHAGHIAVDETHVVVGLGDLSEGTAPGNYIARRHAKSRQHKGMAPAVIGLTLGIAAASPDQPRAVPDLCLGASLHHPTGGLGPALLTIIDSIQANNLRAPRPSNRNQYTIVDGGYTEAIDLNRQLHLRGYTMIMEYAKTRRIMFEIGAVNHDNGDRTPGIYLYNGRPLCPGAGRKWLEALKVQIPKDENGNLLSGLELQAHAKLERRLAAATMATNGRPEEAEARPRGGQPKTPTAGDPDTVMRVTLTCPAVTGRARCPIFDNYNDPDLAHLPAIPDAPVNLTIDTRPACCTNDSGKMRVNIPLDAFKTWQEFMPGTWEHEDWYTAPRSANERYNNLLKRPHGGGDLSRGAIAPRKAAPFALAIAMNIANTNRRVMETWDAKAASRGGTLPAPPAHQNRKQRAKVIDAYKADRAKTHRAG